MEWLGLSPTKIVDFPYENSRSSRAKSIKFGVGRNRKLCFFPLKIAVFPLKNAISPRFLRDCSSVSPLKTANFSSGDRRRLWRETPSSCAADQAAIAVNSQMTSAAPSSADRTDPPRDHPRRSEHSAAASRG